jgi:hypothetical protein
MLKKVIKYLFVMPQIVLPFASVYVIYKANTITNTANLLQLINAIQLRKDIFYSVELKEKEISLELMNGGIIDNKQKLLIHDEKLNATASLLNICEFACQQYISKKIDRPAFKSFYGDMIEDIMDKYIYYKELYPAIYTVYTEWRGN